jgi:hypothetical protein
VRNAKQLSQLDEEQILVWADDHHGRTGRWPKSGSGSIVDAPGETWTGVDLSLQRGRRGLPGGASLAKLLAKQRGTRNHLTLPILTESKILAWADSHHKRTGQWPGLKAGQIDDAEETWSKVNTALTEGLRGLPGGSSLTKLLEIHRGVRNIKRPPFVTEAQILCWADEYNKRTGKWPTQDSGPILNAPSETWLNINHALRTGLRGLPGGCSLAQLLARLRGARNHLGLPTLTAEQILAWVDAHHRATGKWPNAKSGSIPQTQGETWNGVTQALSAGLRGLPGGASLAKLLAEHRNVRNRQDLSALSHETILAWADAHYSRTGRWPGCNSGSIVEAPGETWSAVRLALAQGLRGLPGGSSLARLLGEHRKKGMA